LVSLLAVAQAVRLLGDPPVSRRPWIVLAVLLSIAFWTNFSALALWLGLAAGGALVVLIERRAGGLRQVQARLLMRGLFTAYGWATILSARGLWRMYVFATADRGIAATGFGDAIRAARQAVEQLSGAGRFAPLVFAGAGIGLWLLWRNARSAACILAAIAAATLAMIVAGRSMHHMIAARYFTVLQPSVWIALAALPVLAAPLVMRATLSAALAILVCAATWQSTHIDDWIDVTTWRYTRSASRLIHQQRAPGDLFACTPVINFRMVARYYDLVTPRDDELLRHMADRSTPSADFRGRTAWLMAYMHHRWSAVELRSLLDATRPSQRTEVDPDRLIAILEAQGASVVRIAADRVDVWAYDPRQDTFYPLPATIAGSPTTNH
jgi:hypothetical protein